MKEKEIVAEYNGKLTILDKDITCAVLNNGARVLSDRSLALALGVRGGGAYWKKRDGIEKGALIPEYISAEYLRPFISEALIEKLSQSIIYKSKAGGLAKGVKAELLPEICDVWIKAKEKGALNPKQSQIAEQAYILLKGFAHTGIVALVDEATGYQSVRDKEALQRILDKYIKKELSRWAKRFPDEFYRQMFRLRGWRWNGISVKRPSVVGKYTEDIVYERLAPGILEELKTVNPKTEKGYRKNRHHQWLTDDIGHPKLRDHLSGVIALMRAAPSWDSFKRFLDRSYPKPNTHEELELEFFDENDEI